MLDLNKFVPSYQTVDYKKPVLVFGAGSFGQTIAKILQSQGYKFQGYVTSSTWFEGHSHTDCQIILGVFNRNRPYTELVDEIKRHGFQKIIMPWDIYNQFHYELKWKYWLSQPNIIVDNQDQIETLYHQLTDQHSKNLLLDICKFRLGSMIEYSAYQDSSNQYFNELTLKNSIATYVDGGAYSGDSYRELLQHTSVGQAFLFEPDRTSYYKLKTSVNGAICLPLALSDSEKLVKFNMGSGESAAINENGLNNVMAVSIDSIFADHPVDFIKLDLEGGEEHAIAGAKYTITKQRPVLAISIYHRPEDIFKLPNMVIELCQDYNFYIRQHYYNSFDCVFYAVPK